MAKNIISAAIEEAGKIAVFAIRVPVRVLNAVDALVTSITGI